MSVCAVIPAAGRGMRLHLSRAKILAPISETDTIWSILCSKLGGQVQHLALVLSPSGFVDFEASGAGVCAPVPFSVVIQEKPIGMGDAIFRAAPVWRYFDSVLVVWGDQVNVSRETIRATLDVVRIDPDACAVALIDVPRPYVQYDFSDDGRLCGVRQEREGESVDERGWTDVGVFALPAQGLEAAWKEYCRTGQKGAVTAELNFLPFLVFLASRGRRVHVVQARDVNEARGVNTPEDLEFARRACGI